MAKPARRRKTIWRIVRWALLAFVLLAIITFGRPTAHIIITALGDRASLVPVPLGFADVASRLNSTAVNEIIDISLDAAEAERQLAALLQRAAQQNLKISIAGAKHTMGGHTISPNGIVVNMQPFNRIELDDDGQTLHVQAGARWDQIIPYLDARGRSVEIMQSNNSFTVGGSISANCHGWQPNRPPIASTVQSFRLMKADGSIIRCSREQNRELFSLVLGGYGLFGIILDIDLRVIPNERYRMQRFVIDAESFADVFAREVIGHPQIGMTYGRLCVTPSQFLDQAVLNVFVPAPCEAREIPLLAEPSLTALKRAVFRGSADSDYGKELRWEAELMLSDRLSQTYTSRNQLLNDPVELYQNRSASSTDILHEYFVPPENLERFVQRMREIIPHHHADLLNVTIRHVLPDPDAFLRYADREMFALVLLFNQARTSEADAAMEALTGDLIDAARELHGRYYLPYRLHATADQFHAAYPQAQEFFNLKRQYDPHELFQNQFYLKYGAAASNALR